MWKRLMLIVSLAVGMLVVAPTPEADARGWGWGKQREARGHHVRHQRVRPRAGYGVPELDPTSAGGAMVLLIGGIAYIASRRREEDAA